MVCCPFHGRISKELAPFHCRYHSLAISSWNLFSLLVRWLSSVYWRSLTHLFLKQKNVYNLHSPSATRRTYLTRKRRRNGRLFNDVCCFCCKHPFTYCQFDCCNNLLLYQQKKKPLYPFSLPSITTVSIANNPYKFGYALLGTTNFLIR